MKTTSLLLAFLFVASLTGCSTTIELSKISVGNTPKVSLRDSRSPEERIYRRDSVLAPVQYFGDEDFDSPPLDQLATLLGNKIQPGHYELEVTKFRVIDIFPQRMGGAIDGAMMGVFSSMGYSVYVSETSSMTQDNITCLVGGSFKKMPISASASVPYRISPMAGMVKKDAAFREAVNECLNKLSEIVAKTL